MEIIAESLFFNGVARPSLIAVITLASACAFSPEPPPPQAVSRAEPSHPPEAGQQISSAFSL